jgi:hypothetical protein
MEPPTIVLPARVDRDGEGRIAVRGADRVRPRLALATVTVASSEAAAPLLSVTVRRAV